MSIDAERREGPAENKLEIRLRAASVAYPQRGVPEGAWQDNQQRLLSPAAASRRSTRRLLLVAAAVVVTLVIGGGAVLLGGPGGRLAGPPASGSDPFAVAIRDGKPVLLEKVAIGGTITRHEAVLSSMDGKGVSLCDRYVSSGGSAGGCTSREENADQPSVAFDWLSGTMGSGSLRGVLGGVDKRVARVDIWMANGDRVVATLKPAGDGAGDRLFAHTASASSPRPHSLVAYGPDDEVLQSVDLESRFGLGWLTPVSPCTAADPAAGTWPPPGSGTADASIRIGSSTASVGGGSSYDPTCVTLHRSALAGWTFTSADTLVVLVAPPTVTVRLTDPSGTVSELKVAPSTGSPFRGVVFRGLSPAVLKHAQLQARYAGQVLDTVDLGVSSSSSSPAATP